MRGRRFLWVAVGAGLIATCGHSPPEPPGGMARLIVKCCQLVGVAVQGAEPDCRPNRTLDGATVLIDREERGTCKNWRGDGAILAVGRHIVQVRVPLAGPLEEGECCVDAGANVNLHAGEILTQPVGLKAFASGPSE